MQSTHLPALAVFALSALSAAPAGAHVFTTHDVGPGEDWCAVIQYDAANGDVIRLAPGDYHGGCLIAKSGIPDEGEPLAVVAAEPGTVRIVGEPGEAILTIVGNYVRLGGLVLAPGAGGTAMVAAGRNLLVDGCHVVGGAIGIDAGALSGGLSLIGNTFDGVGTPIAAGCDDAGCDRARGILRDNLFRSPRQQSGPAVTVRADIGLELEGNVVEGRWEVGMHLLTGGQATLARNVVLGGGRGLVLEGLNGGAARVQNVVAVGLAGAALEARGLSLQVEASTLETRGPEAVTQADGTFEGAGNAVAEAAPSGRSGQVACGADAGCWVDPSAGDFRPVEGGPLTEDPAAHPPTGLRRDLCGGARTPINAAGAIAPGMASMRLQPVRVETSGCFAADYVDRSLQDDPDRQPPSAELPVGCDAGVTGPASVLAWLLACLGLLLRRRCA